MIISKTHQLAIELADAGFFVHPCKLDKTPLTKWRIYSTNDSQRVESDPLWERAARVGIDCGKSNLAVIDFDPGHAHYVPPPTVVQETPRGKHCIYRDTHCAARNGILAKNIDIRGQGGYFIWYGTTPVSALEDCSEWDPTIQCAAPGPDNAAIPLRLADATQSQLDRGLIEEGSRNQTLYTYGLGFISDYPNASLSDILSFLEDWNTKACTPELDFDELLAISQQVERSVVRRRAQREAKGEEAPEPLLPEAVRFDDVEFPPMPKPLFGNWLFPGSLNVIYSRAGVGKTGLMTRIIRGMREGRGLLNESLSPYQGSILWVNGDLPAPLAGVQLGQELTGLSIDYLDAYGKDLNKMWGQMTARFATYGLVVLDTRGSLFHADDLLDHNSTLTLFRDLQHLASGCGCAIILLTHAGKQGGGEARSMFGPSASEWLTDNIIGMARPTLGDWDRGKFDKLKVELNVKREQSFYVEHEKAKWGPPMKTLQGAWLSEKTERGYTTGRRFADLYSTDW